MSSDQMLPAATQKSNGTAHRSVRSLVPRGPDSSPPDNLFDGMNSKRCS